MATPELSMEELEIAEDGDDFTKKGALGIISLNLYGETIAPQLTIDKKTRNDGTNHLSFKYWSIPNDPEAPNPTQKMIYTNNSKADMIFKLNINGPFEIVKTKSNTGAVHPLATPSKSNLTTFSYLICEYSYEEARDPLLLAATQDFGN